MSLYSGKTYDKATLLKAAGLVAASGNETPILDLGDGMMECDMVVDVTAVEVASGDEVYTIQLKGSNAADMSNSVVLAERRQGFGYDTATGRRIVPVRNEVNGTLYRYVRLSNVVAGTIATGLNYSAFLARD